MSEQDNNKDKKKQQSETIDAGESNIFPVADALVIKPQSNRDLSIPSPQASYTEYKASEETQSIAFTSKKREYLKGIARHDKFVVFLDTNTPEQYKKNPVLDPKYAKQVILVFRSDISNRQYEEFSRRRAEVQDMERSSYGSIVDFKEMGVRPPEDFTTVRMNRFAREKELYDIGLRIFFKMKENESAIAATIPEGLIDLMEMRSTRDLIDAMDIRLNLGIQESVSTSTDILSTKKNMSTSIT